MKFENVALADVVLIEPAVYGDNRGFFMETWESKKFQEAGIDADFVQDNHSRSTRGILRGLHYQLEQPQGKLVRVVTGEVFDVAVDVRKSSPQFGQWYGTILSEQNKRMLWVPPGFAHGFLVLSGSADFVYKCSDYYHPQSERTIAWNDPHIGIDWPLGNIQSPTLADKDARGALLSEAEVFE